MNKSLAEMMVDSVFDIKDNEKLKLKAIELYYEIIENNYKWIQVNMPEILKMSDAENEWSRSDSGLPDSGVDEDMLHKQYVVNKLKMIKVKGGVIVDEKAKRKINKIAKRDQKKLI